MNRKGQALVEFVLILPVFLLILFAIVDFGNVLNSKNQLESTSTDVVRLVLNGEDINSIKSEYSKLNIEVVNYQDKYRKVILVQDVKIITPFLDRIFADFLPVCDFLFS